MDIPKSNINSLSTQIACLTIGMGQQTPLICFFNTYEYFKSRFANDENLQNFWTSYMKITIRSSVFITLFIQMFWASKKSRYQTFSAKNAQILLGLFLMCFGFLIYAVMTRIPIETELSNPHQTIIFLIISLFICSVVSASQITLYAYNCYSIVGSIDSSLVINMMAGQSLAGVLLTFLQLIVTNTDFCKKK